MPRRPRCRQCAISTHGGRSLRHRRRAGTGRCVTPTATRRNWSRPTGNCSLPIRIGRAGASCRRTRRPGSPSTPFRSQTAQLRSTCRRSPSWKARKSPTCAASGPGSPFRAPRATASSIARPCSPAPASDGTTSRSSIRRPPSAAWTSSSTAPRRGRARQPERRLRDPGQRDALTPPRLTPAPPPLR